jgi:hypothetical protein
MALVALDYEVDRDHVCADGDAQRLTPRRRPRSRRTTPGSRSRRTARRDESNTVLRAYIHIVSDLVADAPDRDAVVSPRLRRLSRMITASWSKHCRVGPTLQTVDVVVES